MTPDQTTPITDDDRQAHEWCDGVDTHPNVYGDRERAAARAIRTHVPAPPKSLADELRDVADQADGIYDLTDGEALDSVAGYIATTARALADRVEAVEVENVSLRIERDQADYLMQKADRERAEARAAEKDVQRTCDDWEAEARKARAAFDEVVNKNLNLEADLHEARAEVERLAAQIDRLTDVPPGMYELDRALPAPADVPDGEAWSVVVDGEHRVGIRCESAEYYEVPWATSPAADSAWWVSDDEITLIARLVPDTRRVIDKPEDLDALPVGSVVLDDNGASSQKVPGGDWEYGHDTETAGAFLSLCGPVTVIHVPEVTA